MSLEKHFLHLKIPELQQAEEVQSAVDKKERLTGEDLPNNPTERIEAYLDRLEHLILDPSKEQKRRTLDGESRPRALSLLREMVMNKYVRSNKQKLAEGAARVEERAAREMGINAHYGEQELEQRGDIAVEDLEKSLDQWIMYLSDANEPYPTWFRYYVFRNILDLGDFDKDKGEFARRSQGSTRLFPDIDRGALAYIEQMIEAGRDSKMLEALQRAQREQANQDIPTGELITKAKADRFAKLSFAKQYAEAIKQSGEITPEMREETRGQWVKYQKGTDPTALWASLQNKGTAWCTKGFATAQTQLNGGDFYVYYTLDKQGKPTIPRIAIRMQGDTLGEVRGVADSRQNLEGNMTDIADDKMNELPGAERYKKISADMRRMTEIEKKTKAGQPLTREELTFLYEVDATIEGFGYAKDPRIKEVRDQRNPEEDMLTIFDCTKEEIATNPNQIAEKTKAYVGPWDAVIYGIIKKHSNIQHLYESFPDKKIFTYELQTDPQMNSWEMAEAMLKSKGIWVSDYALDLLKKTEFSHEGKTYDLVQFTVEQLGFPRGATTDQIFTKAQELGLELCPAEVGPQLRLSYSGSDWKYIAMKQIAYLRGYPYVFDLYRNGGELVLDSPYAEPDGRWDDGYQFVFCVRK